MKFELLATDPDSLARRGRLTLAHGVVETPVFMPVGTQATVKTLSPQDLRDIDAQIVLGNTFHLYLRPGADLIQKAGGLHGFMSWERPLLTDSGGFQVFSLSKLRTIDEDGVNFQSPYNGSPHRFTPESATRIQGQLGADILMAFDECAPWPCDKDYALKALERTARWAARCKTTWLAELDPQRQSLFGIVQGSTFVDLRLQSARQLVDLDLPGYAIGGLSVGEPKPAMLETLEALAPILPADKPRYLMGVGTPEDLWEGIARGIDMFDCVFPSRMARNGTLFVPEGRLVLRNARFKDDLTPVQVDCPCYTCQNFSRAYLRHLIMSDEVLGLRLNTLHNLSFMLRLAAFIRKSIENRTFSKDKRSFFERYIIRPGLGQDSEVTQS